ncbi:MAG: phosphoesterase [Lutibacter sp.]|uniref:phosphoesterase n=1 Tax=Lutibacter sp. TaxID=1925666 RepID=UPI001A00FC27|nr:phosphoesterase [Lutibacter sp.]NOR27545.1 phosphoesterase [Lutibacter sp.]
MYYFTADEHYNHSIAITYNNRPFSSVEEMNETMIENHNSIVTKDDITIHAGDFGFFKSLASAFEVVDRLNGKHIFLKGSHDHWMKRQNNSKSYFHEIWEKRIDNQMIVVCHYAMKTWHCSHYNSWNLHGHSHGHLNPEGKQYDVGVDCNQFHPVSLEEIRIIMDGKPDNFNLIRKDNG